MKRPAASFVGKAANAPSVKRPEVVKAPVKTAKRITGKGSARAAATKKNKKALQAPSDEPEGETSRPAPGSAAASVPSYYVSPAKPYFLGDWGVSQSLFREDVPRELCEYLLQERVNSEELSLLAEWVNTGCFRPWQSDRNDSISVSMATMCSGTHAPVLAGSALMKAIQEKVDTGDRLLRLDHKWSAEKDLKKRRFIDEMCPSVPAIFEDVQDLANFGYAKDYKSKKAVRIVGGDLLVAGFPCTDVSKLSPNAKTNQSVIESCSGATGGVFSAICEFLGSHSEAIEISSNMEI